MRMLLSDQSLSESSFLQIVILILKALAQSATVALGVTLLTLWLWWIRKGIYLALWRESKEMRGPGENRRLQLFEQLLRLLNWCLPQWVSNQRLRRLWQNLSFHFLLLWGLLFLLTLILSFFFSYSLKWQDGLFLLLLLPLILFDCRYYLIPDPLLYLFLWSGLSLALLHLTPFVVEGALWGVMLGYLLFESIYWIGLLLSRREVMGRGDIKLFAALLAWIGVGNLPLLLLLSALLGLVYGVLSYLWLFLQEERRDQSAAKVIPFAPALGFSGIILYFNLQIFGY